MDIEFVNIKELKPYKGNAKKHPKEQIVQIVKSIKEFGFNDPVGIDENNMIIEGHGRVLAAEKMHLEVVPCVRLYNLTEQQKKAYILAHNKLTMNSDFDLDMLNNELEDIIQFDMQDFGFELPKLDDIDDGYYGDERERTFSEYNLEAYDGDRVAGFYQMPIINAVNHIPSDLISFNYTLTSEEKTSGIHFYIDDYQFERIWNDPEKYIDKLSEFDCMLTPDFSLYMDMPMAMKIWNVYRSKLIGQIMQDKGLIVIPTLTWAEKETFDFCFDGIEQGGTVSVSTIGVKRDEEAGKAWVEGMDEAIKRIRPREILVYGGDIGYTFPKGIKVRYYDTKSFKK